ncbi:AraC family transcriptional regulator [Floccifex sp.]|uniref:AraC family transcriptional regulator n=1 Tax=Floccifex sp. TaxID=2815810 RepID=UPI003F0941EF
MEWMAIIGNSIQFIEEHITENISVEDIAKEAGVSSFYFQKGFSMLCGFSVSEYIRNRRLALAGNDLLITDEKIIDIALKYGYESPDSFAKAFSRFHGLSPSSVRKDEVLLKTFAPLKIKITCEGGYIMDYKIVKKDAFTVIANAKTFSYEKAKEEVPQFWQEHFQTGMGQYICGELGINMDLEMGQESFEYLIADFYDSQKEVSENLVIKTIPSFDWAIFPCKGAMPDALQEVNTKIYTEWLPALKDYEFAAGYCIEYYDNPAKYEKGTQDENYYCEIWIPVKKKQ